MITLEDLRAAVDRPSGTPSFTVALGTVPGLEGSGFDICASYVGAGADATTSNLSAPTGPLGLGWRLPVERIVATHPPGSATADPQYILILPGGGAVHLRALAVEGQLITYAADPYRYWRIVRNLATDSWEIAREDGRRWIYGEGSSARGTIETGVRWGDFAGGSVAPGQESFTLAWNLSRVVDMWGNTFTWFYRQVRSTVGAGTLPYTQATYCERIVGPAGDAALFTYAPKSPAEYEPAHSVPPAPNAWQDRVEKEYLAELELRTPTDSLAVIEFDYTDGHGNTSFLGSGPLTKRLLRGIARRNRGADGKLVPATIPPARFEYVTDPDAPGYGGLASVTTAEGGMCSYTYAVPTALPLCRRDTVLAPPAIQGVSCANPRFWFADEYVVVAWQRSDAHAEIVAYAWEGRWLASRVGTVAVADAAAYAALEVLTAPGSLFVLAGAQCLASNYDGNALAFAPGIALTLGLTAGETTAAACGPGFAAVLGLGSGTLNRIRWTGTTWALDTVTLGPGGGAGPLHCALDAGDAWTVCCWNEGSALQVRIDRLLGTCAWETHTTAFPLASGTVEGVAVQAGDTFALLFTRAHDGQRELTTWRALMWSADYAALSGEVLASGEPFPAGGQPALLRGSTVAIGTLLARRTGPSWVTHDVGPAELLDVGVDQALTATGSGAARAYSVLLFDPNTASWSSPANLAAVAPGAGEWCARAARADAGGSRWVLFPVATPGANALWHQAPDGTWSQAARIPDTLTAAELSSLAVLEDHCCIYQSGGATHVYALADTGLATAAPVLAGEQVLVPGQPPQLLLGPSAFVTYTGTFGASASTLRLRRVVRGGVDGALTATPLATIAQTTGYEQVAGANGTLAIACTFAAVNATVDPGGWWPAYNLTELAEGAQGDTRPYGSARVSFFNGLTAAELQVPANALVPAPESDQDASVATAPGLYLGAAYYSGALAPDGATVAAARAISWTALSVGAGQYALRVARPAKIRRSMNGVTQIETSTWNPTNGLPAREERNFYDGNGAPQSASTEYRYFSEQYGHPELHLLDAVVQETQAAGGAVTSVSIQTFKAWEPTGVWAPSERYLATTAQPATFNRWNGESVPLAQGWLLGEQIVGRTARGLVSQTLDAQGFAQSAVYDASGCVPVAAFAGADADALQAGYYGCEVYENPAPWSYEGGALTSLIVADDAHTGQRCLRVPSAAAGSARGLAGSFVGTRERYVFSCWMRVPSGSNANATNARWQVFIDAATTPAATLPFPAAGGWTYVSVEIDLTRILAANIAVVAVNESNLEVYVDELRYSPQAARYSATVYDPPARRPRARIAENGVSERAVLDASGCPVAQIGAGDTVRAMLGAACSRTVAAGGGALATSAFDPAQPNSLSALAGASAGRWMGFGRGDAAAWTLPADWALSEWRLRYNGTVTDPVPEPPYDGPAILNAPTLANFAARVRFEPGTTTRSAGIGLENLIVHWDAQTDAGKSGWIIGCKPAGGQWMSVAIREAPLAREWLIAAIDGRVLFWADGVPIFAYPLSELAHVTPAGRLCLFAADACAFAELAVMPDPRLSVAFSDGAGQFMQQLDFFDDSEVQVSGVLSDTLRRQCVARESVTVSASIPKLPDYPTPPSVAQGRVDGAVATYLIDEGVRGTSALTIAQYLALDPPPFAQRAYDNTPLGLVTHAAPAGTALSSPHAASVDSAAHTASDALSGLGYDGAAAGQYLVQSALSPDGVASYTLCNAIGQTLARRVQTGGIGPNATYATTQHYYDPAGRPVKELLPNAYPAGGGAVDQRWARTRGYTFVGQLANSNDPDGGQVQYNYDELGRLRFRLDADGAAQTPPVIVYLRYDALGRFVEEGTIQSAALDFAAIPQYVSYALPAGVTPVWTRRFYWDRNATTPAEPNLAGRLWRVETANPAGAPDVETYSYDVNGNVVRHQVAVAGYDGHTYQTAYRYDATGALVETVYPQAAGGGAAVAAAGGGVAAGDGSAQALAGLGGVPLKVGRYYDRLGRLVGVGQAPSGDEVFDPRNPVSEDPLAQTYARFEYDAAGRLAAESYDNAASAPIARRYNHDPASGLLLEIGGDYHRETLTYTSGGYGGAGYWDGRIASAQSALSLRPGGDPFAAAPVAAGEWAYAYDKLGRLSVAQSDGDAADASLDLGVGASPIVYDANGNLRTVPRVGAAEAYTYPAASDRLESHAGTVALSEDFSPAAVPGWSWGASNGGPSSSAVVDSGLGTGKALKLAGGGPGHVEQLCYRGYLDAAGTYQLSYAIKADSAFATQAGNARWYLQLFTGGGEQARVAISDALAPSTSWQTVGPVSLDVGALAAAARLGAPVVAAGLLLVNAKRGGEGEAAAALYVTNIGLHGGGTRGLEYDANGNVRAAPKLGLAALAFDPVTNRTSRIELAGAEAQAVSYRYGHTGRRTLELVSYPSGEPDRTLYLRDPSGALLMSRTLSGGAEQVRAYVGGASGVFAQVTDAGAAYLLRDHVGSVRAVVPGAGAGGAAPAAQWLDYGPFGELRGAGPGGLGSGGGWGGAAQLGYAGYEQDAVPGLLDLGARIYDPVLRRFLQVDPARADRASYSYAAGDPIGHIDPDGEYPLLLPLLSVAGSTLASYARWRWFSQSEHVPNPDGPWASAFTAELMAARIARALVFWAAHDTAKWWHYTSSSRGATFAGLVAAGSAGVMADIFKRGARSLFDEGDPWAPWADFGVESVALSAAQGIADFVLLAGDPARLLPSHIANVGSFSGPAWIGSILGRNAPANAIEKYITRFIGLVFGCHTCGAWLTSVADHVVPQSMAGTVAHWLFPQCASCSNRQGGVVRWAPPVVGGGGAHRFLNPGNTVVEHSSSAFLSRMHLALELEPWRALADWVGPGSATAITVLAGFFWSWPMHREFIRRRALYR